MRNNQLFELIDEGAIHNDLVKIITAQITKFPKNPLEIKELMMQSKQPMSKYLSNSLNLSFSEISEIVESIDLDRIVEDNISTNFNIARLLDNAQLSPELNNRLKVLVDDYYNIDKLSVISISKMTKEYLASSQLQKEDKQLLDAATNVLVASATLWLPLEQGGEGHYSQVLGKKPNFVHEVWVYTEYC